MGQIIGFHANAWNNVAVGAAGDSAVIDVVDASAVSAFGTSSGATTITAWVSHNGVNFYATSSSQVLGSAGDFHFSFTTAARYVRLRSSGAMTITATIAGKD